MSAGEPADGTRETAGNPIPGQGSPLRTARSNEPSVLARVVARLARSLPAIAFVVGMAGLLWIGVRFLTATGSAGAGGHVPVEWDRVRDDPAQTLRVTWMGLPWYPSAEEGTLSERTVELRANIEITPTFLDYTGYSTRRPMQFAGGDVPDVFWTASPAQLRALVKHGFVLELPYEVILKHAPAYVRYLNALAPEAWMFTHADGRNYGLPTFALQNHYYTPAVWRKDWLDRVGLDRVPRTLEEMEEAFRRFRHGDPDGNGRKDTYGMCPEATYWWMFTEVFGAHGVAPFAWVRRNGRLEWGGLQPEVREALALLRRWYREELIDPDFVTLTAMGDNVERFVTGRMGYIFGHGSYKSVTGPGPGALVSRVKAFNPHAVLVAGQPVRGPRGQRGAFSFGAAAQMFSFGRHLAREPAKVLRILHLFEEQLADDDFFLTVNIGRQGEHWSFDPELGIVSLPPYDAMPAAILGRQLIGGAIQSIGKPFQGSGAPPEMVARYLGGAERAHLAEFHDPAWTITDVFGVADVVPSFERRFGELYNLQLTTFSEIVRGDRPLEAFEAFVQQWLRRGGREITAEAQEVMALRDQVWARVGVAPGEPEGPS